MQRGAEAAGASDEWTVNDCARVGGGGDMRPPESAVQVQQVFCTERVSHVLQLGSTTSTFPSATASEIDVPS